MHIPFPKQLRKPRRPAHQVALWEVWADDSSLTAQRLPNRRTGSRQGYLVLSVAVSVGCPRWTIGSKSSRSRGGSKCVHTDSPFSHVSVLVTYRRSRRCDAAVWPLPLPWRALRAAQYGEIRCGSLLPRLSVYLLNGCRTTSGARTISARFPAVLHFAEQSSHRGFERLYSR
jgi:hypothetical protein